MAVYQKYDMDTQRSIWIFIQPFQRLSTTLVEEFSRSSSTHPLALHVYLLGIEASSWRWYLNDVRRSTLEYVRSWKTLAFLLND